MKIKGIRWVCPDDRMGNPLPTSIELPDTITSEYEAEEYLEKYAAHAGVDIEGYKIILNE